MLYTNVSRGLFEAHKMIFSFLNITSINWNAKLIPEDQWSCLLRGGAVSQPDSLKRQLPNPDEKLKYITEISWNMVYFIELTMKDFSGIMSDFVINYE